MKKIEVRSNKRTENIKGMLYCAIIFGDVEMVDRILHPKGNYAGMTKGQFLYKIRKESMSEDGEFVFPDAPLSTTLIETGNFMGERCFVFKRRNSAKKATAYVFVMHPKDKLKVHRIIPTLKYLNENRFVDKNLVFKKNKNAFFLNLLYKN